MFSAARSPSWCVLLGFGGFAAMVVGIACGDDKGGTTSDECTPGLAGCPCISGMCVGDLECVEDVCTEPEVKTSGGATTRTTSGEDEAGASEVGGLDAFCLENSDCEPDLVCDENTLECAEPQAFSYTVQVDQWVPNDCQGLAEYGLYYKLKVDGVVQSSSESSACPGSWFEFSEYKPSWVLELELWKTNGIDADALVTSFCFRDAAEACAPVPAEVLHDGEFSGPSGTSFIALTFFMDQPL